MLTRMPEILQQDWERSVQMTETCQTRQADRTTANTPFWSAHHVLPPDLFIQSIPLNVAEDVRLDL